MSKLENESYDEFYRRGGWEYSAEAERLFLIFRILQPLRIPQGGRALEIGCGMGLHAALLHELGLEVTALDVSRAGIEQALAHYEGPTFLCQDAHEFLSQAPAGSYDLIFARGMSWFHYELGDAPNRQGVHVGQELELLLRSLREGGCFVLQIRTDFSGTIHETGVRNHTWEELVGFFSSRGDLELLTDWGGLPLVSPALARRSGRNVIIGLRRVAPEARSTYYSLPART
jgi:SAM-dependent methyltransferase